MSELNAIRSGEIYDIIEYEDCSRTNDLYYPKSEADKVIAELKCLVNGLQNRSGLWHYNAVEEHKKFVQADKVIAEKDAEIARLKAICKVHIEAIESMGAGLLQNDEEIRHQKYKRCLAMAKWCDERIARIEKDYAFWRHGKDYAQNFYKIWRKRWWELAERFK